MHRIIEPDADQWDAFVRTHPRAHFLQTSAWGQLKSAFGWRMARVGLIDEGDTLVAGAQILFRKLARVVTLAYLPMGPYVTDEAQWVPLWGAIHRRARRARAAFLKWEPGIYTPGDEPDFRRWGFHASALTIQPPRTICMDLRADDDSLLARMNQGTRRKIRQSQKKDVRYYHGTRDDIDTFNRLMRTTGARNDFGVHHPDYYRTALDLFGDDAALIMAEHEGDPLAGILVIGLGKTAWYPFGASADIKRNLMASYGVQWAAIQWARARGCHWYDLWGIPDADEADLEAQFQERGDGLWGVYGFKRGWGGQIVRSAGAWDYAYNPLVYNTYRAALWINEQV
jgi:lipid II:glycine glycyltransferase (peptidoglycan interpeptide bridge formation enzyme)